jgi:trans-aconitate methyltransferase
MKEATDVFNHWAHLGKDEGMERGHANAVNEMVDVALERVLADRVAFSAVDLGCGNGWVVRKLSQHPACVEAVGYDGAEHMIEKAREVDLINAYHCARFPETKPVKSYQLVHSMEFLYYLKDPKAMLQSIHDDWLEQTGWAVIGIDHYAEHEDSLGWPEALDVHMSTFSEDEWIEMWKDVGFQEIHAWRANAHDGKPGTLAILGRKV